jgi:hypothetical protein
MNATTVETAEERVARGAAYLDRLMPEWRSLIATSKIKVEGRSWLILDQLLPHSPQTWYTLKNVSDLQAWIDGRNNETLPRHGFEPKACYGNPSYGREHEELIAAWDREIHPDRAAADPLESGELRDARKLLAAREAKRNLYMIRLDDRGIYYLESPNSCSACRLPWAWEGLEHEARIELDRLDRWSATNKSNWARNLGIVLNPRVLPRMDPALIEAARSEVARLWRLNKDGRKQ